MPDSHAGRRRTIPTTEVDEMVRYLPPVDQARWNADLREIDDLLGDSALDDPDEDR